MLKLNRRQFSEALIVSGGIGALSSRLSAGAISGPTSPEAAGCITDVAGIRVGHFTDSRRPTGCTAILFDGEVNAGVDFDGSAPGEQQVVMLQPVSSLERIHGILLTGGGPMGLAAVAGAVKFLEERRIGYDWGVPNIRVPIVVGAVIDDLAVGDGRIRPDPEAAYKACEAASPGPVAEGNVGAGAGATVGKMLDSQGLPGMKGGLGTASLRLGEVVIGALAVVNAAGDILDWRTGQILAGARRRDGQGLANLVETLKRDLAGAPPRASLRIDDAPLRSTTLVVAATNVNFNKTQLTKIAMMANCGAARAIRPYHTTGDGDQLFALSTRKLQADVPLSAVGALAGEVVAEAIGRAVKAANSIEGWPAYREFTRKQNS
jgi:L-aminopeptidase/D-esterase-like protein